MATSNAYALAQDLAAALDPCVLARAVGLEPDPWQAQVLRSTSPRLLLLCARQSGKSQVTAILALHTALYRPGCLVLLLSRSLRQSGELFKKITDAYKALGKPVPATGETALTLTLQNGSRIVALPGSDDGLIRGYSGVALLCIDEAARVDDGLYQACRPMLAVSSGRLLALSTPWGKRGWFHAAWTGPEDWERVEIRAHQCPRISPAFLAEERRVLGPRFFDQEYACVFADTVDQLFGYEVVEAAISPDVLPLFAEGGHAWATATATV
jgi:hypothetical protein